MKQVSKSTKKKKEQVTYAPLTKADIKCDMNSKVYYNGNKYMSYQAETLISIGGRGIGKTTWYLGYAVLRWIKKKQQFVYFRRYKPEVKDFVATDSMGNVIDGCTYVGDGTGGFSVIHGDEQIGFILPVSSAKNYKSGRFANVYTIIYDEAIIMESNTAHYITKEVTSFLEFASTISRTRVGVKTMILGNNLDLFNPYFREFKVPMFKEYYYDKNRSLFCEKKKPSAALLEMEKKTALYKLTQGTEYHMYHYDNEVLGVGSVVVAPKPKECKILARIRINENLLNLYSYQDSTMRLYCEHKESNYVDNITYILMKNGIQNYYFADLYKMKLKMFVRKIYGSDAMIFSSNEAGAMLKWVVDNI